METLQDSQIYKDWREYHTGYHENEKSFTSDASFVTGLAMREEAISYILELIYIIKENPFGYAGIFKAATDAYKENKGIHSDEAMSTLILLQKELINVLSCESIFDELRYECKTKYEIADKLTKQTA